MHSQTLLANSTASNIADDVRRDRNMIAPCQVETAELEIDPVRVVGQVLEPKGAIALTRRVLRQTTTFWDRRHEHAGEGLTGGVRHMPRDPSGCRDRDRRSGCRAGARQSKADCEAENPVRQTSTIHAPVSRRV